ncbi:MAG: serine/threonine-protein kinase [bacterium]
MARSPRPNDSGAGERIGKYAIADRLGRGSMGEVYLAHDAGLGRDVALKILAEAHRDNPELRARFVREARAMAMISDPHVVQVFGIDEHDGLPFFVMEFLAGRDLSGLIKDTGGIAPHEAAQIILLAVRGLRAAATKGLVHRDIKPANIIVTEDGNVKVTDFGLAKQINVDPELTAAGVVVGTPDYIAPEQARGDPMDSRADIYSLGCSLFHLIAGTPPFREPNGPNTYMAIINRHMNNPRPHLDDVHPDVDPDLGAICERMMARRPEERPDFDELVTVLEQITTRLQGQLPQVKHRSSTSSQSTVNDGPPVRGRRSGHPSASASFLQGTWISEGVAGLPGWAIIVTILCAAVFLVGLGLRLTGP